MAFEELGVCILEWACSPTPSHMHSIKSHSYPRPLPMYDIDIHIVGLCGSHNLLWGNNWYSTLIRASQLEGEFPIPFECPGELITLEFTLISVFIFMVGFLVVPIQWDNFVGLVIRICKVFYLSEKVTGILRMTLPFKRNENFQELVIFLSNVHRMAIQIFQVGQIFISYIYFVVLCICFYRAWNILFMAYTNQRKNPDFQSTVSFK